MTDPPGPVAESDRERRELRALATRGGLLSRSAAPGAPPGTRTFARRRSARAYGYRAQAPDVGYLPVQAVVDRTDMLSPKLVDIDIFDVQGNIIQVLRYPEFGAYGRLPSDPGVFSLPVSFGTAICPTLAAYAAARCGAMHRSR
jgi:hypothetical protein